LDWTIGLSEKGWTDDKLGLIWLQSVFEKHTAHRTRGVYRLLILDGHGSHVTPEFDLFAKEHSIITLCMCYMGVGETRREYVYWIQARQITMGVQPILIDKLDMIVVARPTIILHIVRVRISRN
jgi:hypothetical protein